MNKGFIKNNVGCVTRTDYYLSVRGTHPTKTASHVGWVKPRKRRTQQNITIRQVLLWLTYVAFELLADVGCVKRTNYYSLVRGTHPTKNEPGYC